MPSSVHLASMIKFFAFWKYTVGAKIITLLITTVYCLGIRNDVMVGDMQLNSDQYRALNAKIQDGNYFVGRSGLKYRWYPNEMPVEIADNIFEYNTQLIHKTISKINRKTCGCFRIR